VHTGCWWEGLREGENLEDPVEYGMIILKSIFRNEIGRYGLDLSGSG
jgi:hypothetical protein